MDENIDEYINENRNWNILEYIKNINITHVVLTITTVISIYNFYNIRRYNRRISKLTKCINGISKFVDARF